MPQPRSSTSGARLALLLIALAAGMGCPSTPIKAPRTTDLNPRSPEPVVIAEPQKIEPAPPVLTVPTVPQTIPIPSPQTNAPVATNTFVPLKGWIRFEDWRRTNQWPAATTLANGTLRFAWRGDTLDLIGQNRFVHFNGTLVALGLGTRNGRDGLELNALDFQKTLIPLTEPCPGLRASDKVLVLDPGHGGHDPGTRSPHGSLLEKEVALDWALRIQKILRAAGWTVFLTRTNDVDLTLPQRVAFCDRIQPDLFISLHFNSIPASGAHEEAGLETYCLTPAGLPSTIVREFEDDPSRIFPNNEFDCENLQWSLRLHRKILAATGARDRGVRRARFMAVVREQRRPAVLIEGGYLSNPREARLLLQNEYREKLAAAVAAAILQP